MDASSTPHSGIIPRSSRAMAETEARDRFERIILFDGQCAFCRAVVSMLLQADADAGLRVCSTHSPAGAELTSLAGLPAKDTFAFFDTDVVYVGVDAYVHLLMMSPRGRFAGKALRHTPRTISSSVYVWVARHRTVFSKLTRWLATVPIPPGRFLADGER